MSRPMQLGIVLLAVGVLIFLYQGINLVRRWPIAPPPPVEAGEQQPDPFPVAQAIGTVATAGGLFLLVLGSRRS